MYCRMETNGILLKAHFILKLNPDNESWLMLIHLGFQERGINPVFYLNN